MTESRNHIPDAVINRDAGMKRAIPSHEHAEDVRLLVHTSCKRHPCVRTNLSTDRRAVRAAAAGGYLKHSGVGGKGPELILTHKHALKSFMEPINRA